MEIEFQNDYTLNTCVYTTPTFTMGSSGPTQLPCNGITPCSVNLVYINNISNIPYPKDLNVSYSSGVAMFKNTSNIAKVLTIGFDIEIQVYAQSCVNWGFTGTVRLFSAGEIQLAESAPFFLGGQGLNTCKLILFNNTNNYKDINIPPNAESFIYARIYVHESATSCIGGIQVGLNAGYDKCNAGAFSGKITFFNYVNA
jgi:hypothetical protein